MEYLIVYSSKTGNTERLAKEIYDELPGMDKELVKAEDFDDLCDADMYFVGFYVDRGSCPMEIADILEKLDGKKIALFATCGMGNDEAYYAQIKKKVEAWLPDDYDDCGFFICQGKMADEFLNKLYMKKESMPEDRWNELVRQYNRSQSHPDEKDIDALYEFIENAIEDGRICVYE